MSAPHPFLPFRLGCHFALSRNRPLNEEVMINDLHSLLAWNWRPATDRLEALAA
jgi:hypothetical protein